MVSKKLEMPHNDPFVSSLDGQLNMYRPCKSDTASKSSPTTVVHNRVFGDHLKEKLENH